MELLLQREPSTTEYTFGKLYIDGVEFCHTIEDPVRLIKIKGKTAIPAGRYKVWVSVSPRFRRPLPLLVNVPNFEGIRIHSGNTASDTEGCIIVGMNRGKSSVLKSRVALSKLLPKISRILDAGHEVWITVKNA